MQRVFLALSLVAMLGIGIGIGGALTPAVDAQPTTEYSNGGTYVPIYPNTITTLYPQRWQIIIVPVPESEGRSLTLLLDSQTGDSFYLQFGGRYFWSRISQ